MSDVLLVEDRGAVRILTLNRPEARNALSTELISLLYDALIAADQDSSVTAVVLTGSDPALCADVDLKQTAGDGDVFFGFLHSDNPIEQVAAVTKPVVGAVNGPAFTDGLELALSCDFLIASERALFADTHAQVGLLPKSGLTVWLPPWLVQPTPAGCR
jgi:enoyl-CoA hydratase/carnithine racemase